MGGNRLDGMGRPGSLIASIGRSNRSFTAGPTAQTSGPAGTTPAGIAASRSRLADAADELDRVVTRPVERRPDICPLSLVGSCSSETIEPDLSRAAARLSRRLSPDARAPPPQRHRDHPHRRPHRRRGGCLAFSVPASPVEPGGARSLPLAGALAGVVEDRMRWVFVARGVGPARFVPPRRATEPPSVGPGTGVLLARPFPAATARASEAPGARLSPAPFPLGAAGGTAWTPRCRWTTTWGWWQRCGPGVRRPLQPGSHGTVGPVVAVVAGPGSLTRVHRPGGGGAGGT